MKSDKRATYSNYDLTFEEKVGKILCFSEEPYSENLTTSVYLKLKSLLTPNETITLRSRLNHVIYEDIVNKEYIFRLDYKSRKLLKKLSKNKEFMKMLKEARKVSNCL